MFYVKRHAIIGFGSFFSFSICLYFSRMCFWWVFSTLIFVTAYGLGLLEALHAESLLESSLFVYLSHFICIFIILYFYYYCFGSTWLESSHFQSLCTHVFGTIAAWTHSTHAPLLSQYWNSIFITEKKACHSIVNSASCSRSAINAVDFVRTHPYVPLLTMKCYVFVSANFKYAWGRGEHTCGWLFQPTSARGEKFPRRKKSRKLKRHLISIDFSKITNCFTHRMNDKQLLEWKVNIMRLNFWRR